MVGVAGLEPAASWSQTTRATICATPRRQVLLYNYLRGLSIIIFPYVLFHDFSLSPIPRVGTNEIIKPIKIETNAGAIIFK